MPGNNQSTANLAAVGAALASLLVWFVGTFVPAELMQTFPEAPFVVLITWLFCRYIPREADPAELP